MVEIYNQPAIIPVTATLKRYVNNVIEQKGTKIDKVCFYEQTGKLETGMLGVTKKALISQTDIPIAPNLRDQIIIETQTYIINNIKNCNYNPLFKPFWELEVKSVKANNNV